MSNFDSVKYCLDPDGRPAISINNNASGRSAWVLATGSDTWHSMNIADALYKAGVLSPD